MGTARQQEGQNWSLFNPEGGLRIQMESAGGCLPVRRSSERELPGNRAGIIGTFFNLEGGPKDTGGGGRRRLPVRRSSERELPGGREDEIGPFFQRFGSLPPCQTPLRKIPHHFKARLSRQLRRPPRSHRATTPALCLGSPQPPLLPHAD